MTERLVYAAIKRDGIIHGHGNQSHYGVRAELGDPSPGTSNLNDEEGFLTSTGRFVSREAAGQTRPQQRPLLSSDIHW